MIGELVGSYRIIEELGSGGMGVVYAAEHVVLGNRAAVKMLLQKYSGDKEVVTRFFNEARAATKIRHPGIVSVFDFGNHVSGSAYLVMEYLEGETLAQRIKRVGKLSWRETLVLGRQTAGALEAAHRAGIVHRDLKPHNLFLVRDPDLPGGERVKVLDFGIAKLARVSAEDDTGHTREGAVLGTPKYMAPEQCRGAGQVDERADVYSLGCVLFAMICGEPPFSGEGSGEVMAKQIYEPPPRPSSLAPELDGGVETLILRCLRKSPADRPASMQELGSTIDTLLGRDEKELTLATATTAPSVTTTLPPPVGIPTGTVTATATSTPPAEPRGQVITTLGGSAAVVSDSRPRARAPRRSWLTASAVGGVLAIGTVIGVWTRSANVATSAALPADAAVVVRQVEADAAPTPPILPAPVERVTLQITSEPPGAAIVRTADGEWLGQTPRPLRMLPADGDVELTVRLRGYREQRIRMRTDADGERHVVLEKERGRSTRATAPASTPTPAPGPAPASTPAPPVTDEDVGDGTLDPFSEASK